MDNTIIVRDINLVKWIGANSVRTAHHPFSEEFYNEADQQGILIIDEIPAIGMKKNEFFSEETLKNHKQAIYEMIRKNKNHPSVLFIFKPILRLLGCYVDNG